MNDNKTRLLKVFIGLVAACSFLFSAVQAHAYGPVGVAKPDDEWVARHWKNNTMEYYVDGGRLSADIDSDKAVAMVQELMGKWANAKLTARAEDGTLKSVSTTTIRPKFKGKISGDIKNCKSGSSDGDTRPACGSGEVDYKDFYERETEKRTVVVFDEDGMVTKDAGLDNLTIAGASKQVAVDDTGEIVQKGFVIMNGALLKGSSFLPEAAKMTEKAFRGVILHELGHLLGVDHSQTNYDLANDCTLGELCPDGNTIPTMYPGVVSEEQSELAYDDIIGMSWLYPTEDFKNSFCTITGELFDADGLPIKQINVIAMRAGESDTTARTDARSFVSGAQSAECQGDGKYYLRGIIPGYQYKVSYEAIDPDFVDESGFEPLSFLNPPPQPDAGEILSPDGQATVTCASGGQTIEMASVNMEASVANHCKAQFEAARAEEAKNTKKWCGVLPGGSVPPFSVVCILIAIVGMVGVRRKA